MILPRLFTYIFIHIIQFYCQQISPPQYNKKMRKNKQWASFLSFKKTTIKFKKIASYRLIDDVRMHSDKLLTQEFAKEHLKELQMPLFQYEVEDSYKNWIIVKKLEDFQILREQLRLKYGDIILHVPVKNSQKISQEELTPILDFFQHFLNQIGNSDAVSQDSFLEFIGSVVGHSLKQLKIFYQGTLSKRAGGRYNQGTFKKIKNAFTKWEDRLVSITPEGLYLCQQQNLSIEDCLMFSSTFSFLYGQAATGDKYGLVINSSQRVLSMQAKNIFNLHFFVRFLSQALEVNEDISSHRFASFAPLRPNCDAKYYIDGKNYFSDLYDAIMTAKSEVFITGWMVSPYFSLKRPDPKANFRVDTVFSKIANAGIKVHIVLFNAPKIALNIDSEFTQKYLQGLSSNIKVFLHPNYILIPFLWSHHQKMVVIDQKIAFMGGLDIGYGRYDFDSHLLTDPKGQIWPGVDFCNYRQVDIQRPKELQKCSINPQTTPRMPWHDIGVRLFGSSVQDLCRHFIQYWNYVHLQEDMSNRELLMYVGLGGEEIQTIQKQEERKKKAFEQAMNHRSAVRLGSTDDKEQENIFQILNVFKRKKNQPKFVRSSTIKLPFALEPDPIPEKVTAKSSNIMCFADDQDRQQQFQKEKEYYVNEMKQQNKITQFIKKFNPKAMLNPRMATTFEEVRLAQIQMSFTQKKRIQHHQILRSAAMWGIGLEQDKPEHSIWNAYLHLIQEAKEFIFIQNQFFMSIKNGVAQAIAQRIVKAHRQKQPFRVVILLPALPGFDGHPANESAAVFRIQLHHMMTTVNILYDIVKQAIPSSSLMQQYLFVFSLRNHCLIQKTPVTEIIYIHSKLMIIDDRIALIGSANINDRSLKGTRDSELAVVIEDEESKFIEWEWKKSKKVREVSVFAHQLRKELYMEHFNLTQKQAEDYFSDTTWSKIVQTSKKNHQIYRILFGCYPDNAMSSFSDMEQIKNNATSQHYEVLKTVIKSHAIPYQRHFLCDEDLTIHPGQAQYFVPEISFT